MTSYHRRVYVYPQDTYSLAIVKLGSGSNLLGYYMYHGGTNPEGHAYLNEMQRTPYTTGMIFRLRLMIFKLLWESSDRKTLIIIF